MKKTLIVLGSILVLNSACKKDEPEPDPVETKRTVTVQMNHVVNDEPLVFEKYYLSPGGDSFLVNKFNYYVSNIEFIKNDGSSYAQPESYFVVRHPAALQIKVPSVPPGTYSSMRFMIGVDSLRNTSGAQTGGLDVATNGDMFWSWSSGYIFLKLEGKSPASGHGSQAINYHIGGFKGENKGQRQIEIDFGSSPLSVNGNDPVVKLTADVNELFTSPHHIDFSTFWSTMKPDSNSRKIADNYGNMIKLSGVQN